MWKPLVAKIYISNLKQGRFNYNLLGVIKCEYILIKNSKWLNLRIRNTNDKRYMFKVAEWAGYVL